MKPPVTFDDDILEIDRQVILAVADDARAHRGRRDVLPKMRGTAAE
jgi:hypothetical protein